MLDGSSFLDPTPEYLPSEDDLVQLALGTMFKCLLCKKIKPINASNNWCKECFEVFVGMEP